MMGRKIFAVKFHLISKAIELENVTTIPYFSKS